MEAFVIFLRRSSFPRCQSPRSSVTAVTAAVSALRKYFQSDHNQLPVLTITTTPPFPYIALSDQSASPFKISEISEILFSSERLLTPGLRWDDRVGWV